MTLSELIESVDILEYISQYAEFSLKKGEYWALSPLKDENTPSFSVNTDMQSFYDFSSGRGGNLLTFIRCYNNCDKEKAEGILRAYSRCVDSSPARSKMVSTKIAKRFARKKKQTKLSKSVILPDNYMQRYDKDNDKISLWLSEGISEASINKFQVFYDSFSDRLVYPIRTTDGKIINISGRTLDKDWKAKDLRKYTYFKPLGVLDTLYGLAENKDDIIKKREIIIFEGAKSVMLADTFGIVNSAALLTSHLNQFQLKILAQLGCRVVFALDKDICIKDDENIRRLKRFVKVEYILDTNNVLDAKMSPIDAGFDVWENLYEGRLSYR